MAKKSTRSQGKARGQAKAKKKPSKAKDLPLGSRAARSVKGGSFTGNLIPSVTRNTVGGGLNPNLVRNKFTV